MSVLFLPVVLYSSYDVRLLVYLVLARAVLAGLEYVLTFYSDWER